MAVPKQSRGLLTVWAALHLGESLGLISNGTKQTKKTLNASVVILIPARGVATPRAVSSIYETLTPAVTRSVCVALLSGLRTGVLGVKAKSSSSEGLA